MFRCNVSTHYWLYEIPLKKLRRIKSQNLSYEKHNQNPKGEDSLGNIHLHGYGILGIVLLYSALKVQLPELALVGFFAMFPIIVVNLIFYIIWKKD